jgi:hypothetical protein
MCHLCEVWCATKTEEVQRPLEIHIKFKLEVKFHETSRSQTKSGRKKKKESKRETEEKFMGRARESQN